MLSLLLASSVAAAPDWTLLAFPRGARAEPNPVEDLLLDAAHLDVDGPFRPASAVVPEPLITTAMFQQMLDESLRQRGLKLETRPQGGMLLAKGDAPALEAARALVADLDRQVAALAVDLEVGWKSGSAPESRWRRQVTAGAEVFLGSRSTRAFVAGFDVQVAQDAGQAEPRLGSALSGTGLHLRATRLAGGTRVFLDGVLDVAVIAAVEPFDPGTPDLGVLDQPRVESVQLAFAGAVDSGGVLEVRLADAGPLAGESVLTLRATARPDAPASSDGWVLVDLGFTALAARPLVPVDPGLGFLAASGDAESAGAPLAPAALAALLESERGPDARGGRAQLLWSRTLLAIPRADAARIDGARALLRAAEEARSATQRVAIACGPLRATFPVANGRAARLVAGSERPYLADYGLEVAPQIWMPSPRVERAFDGIEATVALADGIVELAAWRSSTGSVALIAAESAQMGKLQLPERARVAGAARTGPGAPPASVFDQGAPLTLTVGAP